MEFSRSHFCETVALSCASFFQPSFSQFLIGFPPLFLLLRKSQKTKSLFVLNGLHRYSVLVRNLESPPTPPSSCPLSPLRMVWRAPFITDSSRTRLSFPCKFQRMIFPPSIFFSGGVCSESQFPHPPLHTRTLGMHRVCWRVVSFTEASRFFSPDVFRSFQFRSKALRPGDSCDFELAGSLFLFLQAIRGAVSLFPLLFLNVSQVGVFGRLRF